MASLYRLHRLARELANATRGCSLPRTGLLVWFVSLTVICPPARAEIAFEEATREAGISRTSWTYGASWGDVNGDGWPDLWVSNHVSRPSLYLNQGDGTFREVASELSSADPEADTHAAAWADFDGDGDQDLVELVGAVITPDDICFGCGESHFFENDEGLLRERAKELGLHQPVGLGRTPLWFDADRDGRLDLLVVNQRLEGKASSILYRQEEAGFRDYGAESGFSDVPPSEYEQEMHRIVRRMERWLGVSLWGPTFAADPYRGFAQLADLSGDGSLDLIFYSQPTRVYSIKKVPFEEITSELEFPAVGAISDAAVEDFDGDGAMDIYVTRGPYTMSDIVRKSPTEIRARLSRARGRRIMGIQLRTEGEVTFRIPFPTWLTASQIFIGSEGRNPEGTSFTLSPDAPGLEAGPSTEEPDRQGVLISHDAEAKEWTFLNTSRESMEVAISSSKPIEAFERVGFEPFKEQGVDALLVRADGEFAIKTLSGEVGEPTACHSVVAGDFDNDMDVDLYLVCSAIIENLPNRLLENDGRGNFSPVADAGGAAGTRIGRGDVVVTADYDRDGFLDLFVTNGADPSSQFVVDAPHQLFRNRGNENHWIEIDLVGVISNREGIGAGVTLEAGGVVQRRGQGGGMHVFSQNHQRIHFGLGPHSTVDRLTIQWPSGVVQRLEALPADRILEIEECVKTSSDGRCER